MSAGEIQQADAGASVAEEAILPRRRLAEDSQMDITPMIDITFLLLIFFLVAPTLQSEARVELPPAHHGDAVGTKDAVILTVARGTGERAQIYKGDGMEPENLLSAASLPDQEDEISRYVENELNEGSPPKNHVLIKAGRDVKHREVARVAKAVGKVGDVKLYVAVLEEQ